MLTIRVKCEKCKKTLSVKEQYAGKKVKCPACGNIVVVPIGTGQNGTATPQPGAAVTKKPASVGKPAAEAKKPAADATKTPLEVKKPIVPGKKPLPETKKPAAEGKKPAPVAKKAPLAPPKPEPVAPPPEEVEAEALSVFAEDEKPPEVEETPKTINFRCEWCDEEVQLPIEMAGKQSQCPNPECRRIVKVPLPKVAEKKDWRTMDRRGPAGAIVSQPEAPKDAWGTQEATRARQDSLKQAGVIEIPPPPPLGAAGWIMRLTKYGFIAAGLGVLGLLIFNLSSARQQKSSIKEIEQFVESNPPKIAQPVLRAEAYRTLGLLYLQDSNIKNKAVRARDDFSAAQSLIPSDFPKNKPGVNEQLFLIDLALSQIELGGTEDEEIRGVKISWEKTREAIAATLDGIQAPEVQVIALREVATRLIERKQLALALGLAGSWSAPNEAGKRPVTFRQQIALFYWHGKHDTLKIEVPDPAKIKELPDAHARVGYAEGFARKGEYAKAFELIKLPGGLPEDSLDTCLGVAAIALNDPQNKDEASKFVKEGLKIAQENKETSPWLLLQLTKLGTRSLDPAAPEAEALKKLIERLEGPFKQRALLELFLAKCDKSPVPVVQDADFEAIEATDKEGSTLALAWFALAQQHARKGVKRTQVLQTLANRVTDEVELVKLRPIVEVGVYLGRLKF